MTLFELLARLIRSHRRRPTQRVRLTRGVTIYTYSTPSALHRAVGGHRIAHWIIIEQTTQGIICMN